MLEKKRESVTVTGAGIPFYLATCFYMEMSKDKYP